MQITTNLVGRRCVITGSAEQFLNQEATISAMRSADGAGMEALLELDDGRLIITPIVCIRLLPFPFPPGTQIAWGPATLNVPSPRKWATPNGCEFCRQDFNKPKAGTVPNGWTCQYCRMQYDPCNNPIKPGDPDFATNVFDNARMARHPKTPDASKMADALFTIRRICTKGGSNISTDFAGIMVGKDTTVLQLIERALDQSSDPIGEARTNAITNAHGVLAHACQFLADWGSLERNSTAEDELSMARDALIPFVADAKPVPDSSERDWGKS